VTKRSSSSRQRRYCWQLGGPYCGILPPSLKRLFDTNSRTLVCRKTSNQSNGNHASVVRRRSEFIAEQVIESAVKYSAHRNHPPRLHRPRPLIVGGFHRRSAVASVRAGTTSRTRDSSRSVITGTESCLRSKLCSSMPAERMRIECASLPLAPDQSFHNRVRAVQAGQIRWSDWRKRGGAVTESVAWPCCL
jgi:hypothetical protein